MLEERVELLKNRSVDQGRQLENIANGRDNLTVDVWVIRQDQNNGFAKINKRLGSHDK